MNLRLLFLVGFFGVGSLLWAQTETKGDPIRVPLKMGVFDERSSCGNLMHQSVRGIAPLQKVPADQIKSTPKLQNPAYCRVKLGDREVLVIMDVESEAQKAKLYIDFEGKGLFETLEPVEGVDRRSGDGQYANFEFGPVTIPESPASFTVSCFVRKQPNLQFQSFQFHPRNYWAGKLPVADGEYSVFFVNGRLGGKFEPAKLAAGEKAFQKIYQDGATFIGIDFDKNGFLDFQKEVFPLAELMQVEGKYYQVRVADNGSEAQFQEVIPRLGVLDTQCPGLELFVLSEQCATLLAANESGKWELPAGKYIIRDFELHQQEDGVKWRLQGGNPGSAGFEIKPGEPTVIAFGPPLVLKYSMASRGGDAVGLDMALQGQAGETYRPKAERLDRRETGPKFTIQNESGEKLSEGYFQYG